MPRTPHQMGIDVGLVGDGSSVVITHNEDDKIVLDYHEVWYAGVSWREANPHLSVWGPPTDYAKTLEMVERLDFDELALWIKTLCNRFHITAGLFDRWNGIPLEQALHKSGYKQFSSDFFTRDMTSKIYQTTKMLLFDGRLVLYDYPIPDRAAEEGKHSPLISELLALQATQVSKNTVLVEAPKKRNAHDDVSDALVRSVWLSAKAMFDQKHAANWESHRPHAALTGMDARRYQRRRSRLHGPSARNPRAIGRNSMLRGINGR
jgi:hypothetical protein